MGVRPGKYLSILLPGPAGPGCKLLNRGQLPLGKEPVLTPLTAKAIRLYFEAPSLGSIDRQTPR